MADWKNRIIGSGVMKVAELIANPFNYRIHPFSQQEALEGSLEAIGWMAPVVVNQKTGHIVDGHLRAVLALRHDNPEVPVVYVELSEQEEKQALALMDAIAEMAVPDRDKLAELLSSIETNNEKIKTFLADFAEANKILELVEFSASVTPDEPEYRWRVIIDGFENIDEAKKFSLQFPGATVEEYKI